MPNWDDLKKLLQSTIGDSPAKPGDDAIQSPMLDPLDALPIGAGIGAAKTGLKAFGKNVVKDAIVPDSNILENMAAKQADRLKNKSVDSILKASDKIEDLKGIGHEYLMDPDGVTVRGHFIDGVLQTTNPRPPGLDVSVTPMIPDTIKKAAAFGGAALGAGQMNQENEKFKQLRSLMGK